MLSTWFHQPAWLWLLLALLPFAVWDSLRRWRGRRGRQLLSVCLRVLMLAALIVAVARPFTHSEARVEPVVFVIDRSASIDDEALAAAQAQVEALRASMGADGRAALIVFDDAPELVVRPGDDWTLPEHLRPQTPVESTDVASALALALGLIPPDTPGQVVLLSDGQATQGDLDAALAEAHGRQIQIQTIPIGGAPETVAMVDIDLSAPCPARPGETIEGHVLFSGGAPGLAGAVSLRLGDRFIGTFDVQIPEGAGDLPTRVPFEYHLPADLEAGPATIDASFQAAADRPPPDDDRRRLQRAVMIDDPPRVLIITQRRGADGLVERDIEVAPLMNVLEAERIEADLKLADELAPLPQPALAALLDDYQLVILGNVAMRDPATRAEVLPERFAEALKHYVSAGGGLVVLAGDRAYELGDYADSELANILPVEVNPTDIEVDPGVTMIIILDRSGSMGAYASGRTKMDLANEGAVASMQLLRSFDEIGVMAVDDRVHWIVPTQSAIDHAALERSIRSISVGGGGIFVYTSLAEAHRVLLHAQTPLKHIILFSDADDSEEQIQGAYTGWGSGEHSYALTRRMREDDNITLSVIGIGTQYDSDASYLKQLAQEGGGRFYITDDATELKALFVEETQRLVKSRLLEDPFNVHVERGHLAVEGIDWSSAPQLLGHVKLDPRETAEVILRGPDDHPIMTTWQYGLGHVVAMATDAGPRWSANWIAWDGYDTFWTQMIRWGLRRDSSQHTGVEVAFDGDDAHIQVARYTDQGFAADSSPLRARLIPVNADNSDGPPAPLPMRISQPGLWDASSRLSPQQAYRVEVVDADDSIVAAHSFVAPASAERRAVGVNLERLAHLAQRTGGASSNQLASLPPIGADSRHVVPLWLYFILAALTLLPLDALLRRPARE